MNRETLKLFSKLMDKGYITREQDEVYYEKFFDPEISADLAVMEEELDFTIYRTNGRLYLLPNSTNELFSQDNRDFRRSVGNENLETLYLLNYLAMFLLYRLYGGKGSRIQIRNFIKESDFLDDFTKHCEKVHEESEAFEEASARYSIDFINLADRWLSKLGNISNSTDTKHGCFMKVIRKFRDEDLLCGSDSDGVWRPTVKLNDLMPYFLSKERVSEIHSILGGADEDAGNS